MEVKAKVRGNVVDGDSKKPFSIFKYIKNNIELSEQEIIKNLEKARDEGFNIRTRSEACPSIVKSYKKYILNNSDTLIDNTINKIT